MRVLIIDDHEVLWSGMRGVLERLTVQLRPGEAFELQGARDVEAALALSGQRFDLVLLDYHLPEVSGIAALNRVRAAFEETPIVMISGDERPQAIRETIDAGAAGYIPKTMPEPDMVAALSQALECGMYLPPMALLDADLPHADMEPQLASDAVASFMSAELSPRQREVFARALRGKPNKVIARELGIAEGTVKVHLAMVFRALGVRNRTEAMYRVLEAEAAGTLGRL